MKIYYRLADGFVLRGWDKTNAVIIKRPLNQSKALNTEDFRLLTLCDGETDFSEFALTENQQATLKRYLDKGNVVAVNEPTPLDEDQRYRYYPNRFVKSVFWSITGRCNFKCRHCYMNAPDGALGELSHEEAIDLIDQMAECGVLAVDITGGEPFVRKDFWELVDRILSHKITIRQIYTNGWLLTEEVLKKFEQRGIKPEISISFDGSGWHDWMRRVKGAEEAAIRALTLCKEHSFGRNIEMCIHKGNKNSLRETVRKLVGLGVSRLRFGNVVLTELWKCNSDGNDMTQQEYLDAILEYIPHFFEDGMPCELLIGGVIYLHKDSTKYKVLAEKSDGSESCLNCHLCGATRYSCYITPEGRLLPCMPMTACKEQEQFAKVQEMGLRKGLSDSYYMEIVNNRVKDLLEANQKCRECPYKYKCDGGCRAAALQQTGNLLGSDLDQCFLWENGYVEKIHAVADTAIAKYCKEKKADEN